MPCSHGDICPHSSSCTNDVLKVRSMFKLLQDESPWAWLLSCWITHCTGNATRQRPHSNCTWMPWPVHGGSPVVLLLLQSWDWCPQVSRVAACFLTVKPTSSFCPLFKGQGFLQMLQSMIITNLPQSMIITNLPGPLLHRYALDTQNAIWMKGSLPDTSVVWFGCVAGVFRFGFVFFWKLF